MAKRADENGPFKGFRFDEWLHDEFEYCSGQMKFKKVKLDTSEFEAHMRNAAKEQLLAVRSLLDSVIDLVEGQEEAGEPAKPRKA